MAQAFTTRQLKASPSRKERGKGRYRFVCSERMGKPSTASAVHQLLQFLGIASTFNRDLGDCGFQLPEIFAREFDGDGSDVLFESVQLRRTRNWNDPRLLCKQPCQRDLSGRRLFLLRELADQINQSLIQFTVLGRKARHNVAEVSLVELRVFADLAGEEALAQWAERNEPDPEFLECRYDFSLWF